MADPEKDEEIIELTEVVEEKDIPTEAVEGESPFRPEPEKRDQGLIEGESEEERPEGDRQASLQDYGEEVSPSSEGINRKAEEWAASEGVQILERVARKILPGIAAEVLGTEVDKFRGEVEGLRAKKETLQGGVEKWLGSEGVRFLGQIAAETLPRIAGEVLGKEVGKINREVEGLRAEKEDLKARSEQWLDSAGVKVLEQQIREILPGIAAEALGKEVEKLKAAVEELRAEKEALKMKADQWLSSEGIRILKQEAGAMFPRIAEEVLSGEIEKLKKEEGTEEKE
jgi:hypothetical protein